MHAGAYTHLRRRGGLILSTSLVLIIGALGLVAGHAAGEQARDVHRDDRLRLQVTLARLVAQQTELTAVRWSEEVHGGPAWDVQPEDTTTTNRLARVANGVRAIDVGAMLLGPLGEPLASWSTIGALPPQQDPGWRPLRAALLAEQRTTSLSGLMSVNDHQVLALGYPVPLSDGATGMVVGLWNARTSALQQYVSGMVYDKTGHGYVVDGRGKVVAGPSADEVGQLLPVAQLTGRGTGLIDTVRADKDLVVSYAQAGATGWTSLTKQESAEFEGALVRASLLVEAIVVALLLISAAALVLTHRKREVALRQMALQDELTGLYNRRGWFHLAEHELERARRQDRERVLLFVDLDGLKQVNDVLGHVEGDRALCAAAEVLSAATRTSDLVGRIGGDEFVLLLAEGGDADVVRQRLQGALAAHNLRSTAPFELRMSIGVTVWCPETTFTLDELVRRADEQMYAHKSSRQDRHDGVVRATTGA